MSQFNSLVWGRGGYNPVGMGPAEILPPSYGTAEHPADTIYGAHGMNVADPAFGPYGPGGQMTGAYATPVQGLSQNTSAGQVNSQNWATWQMTNMYSGPEGYGAASIPAGLYYHDGYVYGWMPQTATITIRFSPRGGRTVQVVSPGSAAYSAILSAITKIGRPNITEDAMNRLRVSSVSVAKAPAAPATQTSNARSFLTTLINAAASSAATVAASRQAQAAPQTAAASAAPAPVAVVEPPAEPSALPWIVGGAAGVIGLVAVVALAGKKKEK